MSKLNFALLAVVFLLFAGVVSAYNPIGGGMCECNQCNDCTAALNDGALCPAGASLNTSFTAGLPICINNPTASNKLFDLNGYTIDGGTHAQTGIYLENRTNVIIRSGRLTNFTDYGIYMVNVTSATVHRMVIDTTLGPAPGAGIYLGVAGPSDKYDSNSIIYNCSIIDNSITTYGIQIQHANGNEIYDCDLSRNAHGLILASSDDNYVHDSFSHNNKAALGTGFSCYAGPSDNEQSHRNLFLRVNATSNHWGFVATNCIHGELDDAVLSSNNAGAVVSFTSTKTFLHNVTIKNSDFKSNTNYGIWLDDSLAQAIAQSNCTFENNTIDGSSAGIYVGDSNVNFINHNTISGGQFGLTLQHSDFTFLDSNTIHTFTSWGFGIFNSSETFANYNSLYNNGYDFGVLSSSRAINSNIYYTQFVGVGTTNLTIVDSLNPGFSYTVTSVAPYATPAGTQSFRDKFVNITGTATAIDTLIWHWSDSELVLPPGYIESQFELWENSSGVWAVMNATPDLSSNALSIYNLNPASDYTIVQNLTKCPVITSPGAYQLQANLVGAPNAVTNAIPISFACVLIQSSDVYLDLNGSTITNNGTAAAAGIAINGSSANPYTNITIVDGAGVSEYRHGMTVHHASDSVFQNITLHSNEMGVYLSSSSSNNLTSNIAYNNTDHGFYLLTNSNSNNLTSNIAYDNTQHGFFLFSSDHNALASNIAYNNSIGGITLRSSTNNVLGYNFAYNNTGSGFYLTVESNSNNLGYNNATENQHGIFVANSSNSTFIGNRAYNNTAYGLYLDTCLASSTSPNIFVNGQYDDNGVSGAFVEDSTYAQFIGSKARWNTAQGLRIEGSSYVGFAPNWVLAPLTNLEVAYNDGEGVYALSSSNCMIAGDFGAGTRSTLIHDNGMRGIAFESVTDSIIMGTATNLVSIYDNNQGGIFFDGADDNNISYVDIYGNSRDGFYLDVSDGNNISHSSFYGNTWRGLRFVASHNNDMLNLESHSNIQYGVYIDHSTGNSFLHTHLYNNTIAEAYIETDANAGRTVFFQNLTIDSPVGTFTNYTSLTLNDTITALSAYTIKWTTNSTALPAGVTSFENKWVDISVGAGTPSIDEVVWHWTDAEAGAYDENIFTLVKYNVSDGWAILNNTPDTAANTLSWYNFNPSSDYGILNYNASIVVEKTDLTSYPISQGGMAEFQLNITNNGNATLDPVRVVDNLLSSYFIYNNSNLTPDSTSPISAVWNNIGPLAPGESVLILVNATVGVSDIYPNRLYAEGQPSLGDNVTNASTVYVPVNTSSISVLKQSSRSSATIGQKVTFNFTITNDGEVGLNPVIVQDTLPAQLSFTGEASIPPDSIFGQVLTWDTSVIPMPFAPGDTFFVEYNVTVVSTGSAQNNVTVEGEPNNGDNVTDTASVTLTANKKPSGGGDDKPLDIYVDEPVCLGQETIVTIKSGATKESNAEVTIKTNSPGYTYWYDVDPAMTGSDGEVAFTPIYLGTHYLYADKESGYDQGQKTIEVVECEAEVECYTASDCTDKYGGDCYICILGAAEEYNQCVLKEGAECGGKKGDECPTLTDEAKELVCTEETEDLMAECFYAAGTVCIDCMCVPVECFTDDDCPAGEECIDYECTGGEEPPEGECTTDSDCAYDQYCSSSGQCLDLDCVCGYVDPLQPHVCEFYECCSDPVCWRMYGDNYFCNLDIHECEEIPGEEPGDQPIDVDTPDETPVGDEVTITVTSDGNPVPGAEVTIVINEVPYSLGVTDLNGEVTFTPEEPGQYTVLVSKEGFASGEDEFVASEESGLWETIIRGVWILLFILILLAIIYVLATRKKKRRPKEDMEE